MRMVRVVGSQLRANLMCVNTKVCRDLGSMADGLASSSGGVSPEQGTLVDGIGDEVLMLLTLVFAAIGGCALTCGVSASRSLNTAVHPQQEDVVANTRRDIGVDQRRAPQAPGAGGDAGTTQCAVCLGPMTRAIQTNCGHEFCAQCILAYWEHDQWPRAARCPMCRRQVTLLLPSARLSGDSSAEARRIMTQVTDYNQRMSGEWRPLMHYIYDIPALLRHLARELFTVRGLILIRRLHLVLILVLLVVYLILPLDLLPEAVFGVLGLLDDLIIIIGTLVYISLVYRAVLAGR